MKTSTTSPVASAAVVGGLVFTALITICFVVLGFINLAKGLISEAIVDFAVTSAFASFFIIIIELWAKESDVLPPQEEISFGKLMSRINQNGRNDPNPVIRALTVAQESGQIDGAHHKAWVIDQMVRELLGKQVYKLFITRYQAPFYNEEMNCMDHYEWSEGIIP